MICPGAQYSRKRKILDKLTENYKLIQEVSLSNCIAKEECGNYKTNTKETQDEKYIVKEISRILVV